MRDGGDDVHGDWKLHTRDERLEAKDITGGATWDGNRCTSQASQKCKMLV